MFWFFSLLHNLAAAVQQTVTWKQKTDLEEKGYIAITCCSSAVIRSSSTVVYLQVVPRGVRRIYCNIYKIRSRDVDMSPLVITSPGLVFFWIAILSRLITYSELLFLSSSWYRPSSFLENDFLNQAIYINVYRIKSYSPAAAAGPTQDHPRMISSIYVGLVRLVWMEHCSRRNFTVHIWFAHKFL